jgi:hypothetical protein
MSKKAYFISETIKDHEGNYIPCIAVENIRGFYRTDWQWGKDRDTAQRFADKKNEQLGLTKKQAMDIQVSSMRS